MTRPAFQFYVGDWQRNAKLRRCSPAARGVWIDILCLLHDAEEYGVLRWPLKDLAQAAGASMAHVRELVEKGVLKGAESGFEGFTYRPRHAGKEGDPVPLVAPDDGPVWFSSRFVRDEWVRLRRGSGARFGDPGVEQPRPPTRSPTRRLGERQGDGPSSSSSSSTSPSEGESPLPPLASAEEGDARPERKRAFDPTGIELPEWLTRDDWVAWCRDRAARRKPITEAAARLQLKKLAEYVATGTPAGDVLAHAIEHGHQGFYLAARPAPSTSGRAAVSSIHDRRAATLAGLTNRGSHAVPDDRTFDAETRVVG